MSNQRKRFSFVISKVAFDGRVLEVRGRMRFAGVLLLAMTIGMVSGTLLLNDAPVFVRIMMGLGALTTGYGVVDTLFGESYLRFDIRQQVLELRRGNPFAKVSFSGRTDRLEKMRVSRIRAGKVDQQAPQYAIVLAITLPDAFVNFPLEVASYGDDAANRKMAEWAQKLHLAEPSTRVLEGSARAQPPKRVSAGQRPEIRQRNKP